MPLRSLSVSTRPANASGFSIALAKAVRVMKRLLLWPMRVSRARADMAVLAGMDTHELRDIGLTHSDISNASALSLDEDPTVFLARSVRHSARSRL